MLASSSPDVAKKPRYGMSVNDFPSSVWSLLRNATYLCITGTAITEGLLIGGFTYFMPKFIENQFAVTSSAASALCGVAVIPGAAGGTFLGGWFIKKFKLQSAWNDQTFYNCQCIPEFNCTVNGESYSSGCATVGECDKACWTLPVFLMLFFLSMLMNFQLTVPAAAITLRCVPENQRMLAMSIQSVFARLFGAVPGLLIVGATIDSTCLIWQESCDQTGACWMIYKIKTLGGILIDFKTKYRNGAADLAKEEPLIIREDSRANLSDEQTPMKLKAAKDE
ncbi:solute carrier organic anion transporter family member 4C1-like [Saccoglossus kowalevskii]